MFFVTSLVVPVVVPAIRSRSFGVGRGGRVGQLGN
jgi:hypothetical protein